MDVQMGNTLTDLIIYSDEGSLRSQTRLDGSRSKLDHFHQRTQLLSGYIH